ncbi:unnamed protein product [Orchesella dallaii]|uniref:Uncharacterized protein n=1 Tax=Orchesella dallaii TaxID=48710 RepID=A0ABP1QAQ7_9HEXA
MCSFFTLQLIKEGPHSMERFLELHRKIKSKLCKEICGHTLAVIVFSGLVIISVVELLKVRDPDTRKLTAAALGICHFGLCATAILHLKYNGVMELNPVKCKLWIYLEIYNIAATTAFIVLATRHIFPPPFNQWTGTALLLIIYWLPLIMYKTSQVCRMLEFISILNYLHECSVKTIRKPCCARKENALQHNTTRPTTSTSSVTTSVPILSAGKPLSASSPHIPYEWTLIDSFSSALP